MGRVGVTTNNQVTISKCFSTAEIAAGTRARIGGLVGFLRGGEIVDSWASGRVSGSSGESGGLCGVVHGITPDLINRCHSFGEVVNGGGLVGSNAGTVTHSFWDTQTSTKATSAGGTGKTTAEMKDIDTYTTGGADWDMVTVGSYVDEVWAIDDGEDYPILGFEVVAAPPSGTAFWRTRQSSQLSTAGVIG